MHGIPGAGRRSHDNFTAPPGSAYAQQQQQQPNPVDPLLALGTPQEPEISRPYVGDPMFSTGSACVPSSSTTTGATAASGDRGTLRQCATILGD